MLPAVQILVTAAVVVVIVTQWGLEVFRDALEVLPLWSLPVAIGLGGVGALAQAVRWRLVARHYGISVGTGSALMRCWQAAFLNSVLPGGLAGDALRAADDSSDSSATRARRALTGSAVAVAAERLAGTAVVFIAAALVLLPVMWVAAVISACIAGVAAAVAWRWLRVLSRTHLVAVLGLSVLGWAAFVTLFVVAAAGVVVGEVAALEVPQLGAVTVAGMSIPLGVGGWGPREAAAAWVFPLFGATAELGVTASISYGVLALVSTVPGSVITGIRLGPMVARARRARRQRKAAAQPRN